MVQRFPRVRHAIAALPMKNMMLSNIDMAPTHVMTPKKNVYDAL